MNILYVDDDLNILLSYKSYLQKQSLHIKMALTGEQGLAILNALGPFAVVVADMSLPDMDSCCYPKARK